MKMPLACAVCQGPLTHTYYQGPRDRQLKKQCSLKPSHNVSWYAKFLSDDEVQKIMIYLPPTKESKFVKSMVWHLEEQVITDKNDIIINIPFFEPDFANYNKLISKLRTYLLFS